MLAYLPCLRTEAVLTHVSLAEFIHEENHTSLQVNHFLECQKPGQLRMCIVLAVLQTGLF